MTKRSRNMSRKRRQLRVRAKIAGTGDRPRLNVFRSLNEIYAQLIDDDSGATLVAASTVDKDIRAKCKDLAKREQAKVVGEFIARRAKKAGVSQVVFDRGGYKYHGRIKALADAAREAGLVF